MYWAKQRASLPLLTSLPATEQLGVSIGEGVIWVPAACSFAMSAVWAFCAVVTSAAIVCGVMSGVPVICSWARLLLTVFWPLKPMTMAATPKAIRTAAAMMPPISRNLRMTRLLSVLFSCAKSRSRSVVCHPGSRSEPLRKAHALRCGLSAAGTTRTGRRASRSTPCEKLPRIAFARAPWPREPTTIASASIESA